MRIRVSRRGNGGRASSRKDDYPPPWRRSTDATPMMPIFDRNLCREEAGHGTSVSSPADDQENVKRHHAPSSPSGPQGCSRSPLTDRRPHHRHNRIRPDERLGVLGEPAGRSRGAGPDTVERQGPWSNSRRGSSKSTAQFRPRRRSSDRGRYQMPKWMPCLRWALVRASTVASSTVMRVLSDFSQAPMRSSISRRTPA